jgi:hypothetical protein
MSRYLTFWDDFDVDTIGTNVVGFTTRGTAAPNGWAPAYGTPAVKNRFLNFKTNNSGVPLRNVVTWDTIDGDANRANVELLSCFSKDAVTASDLTLVARGVGASGAAATEGYVARFEMAGNIYISKRSSVTAIATIASAAFAFSAGKSYYGRFRVVGTSLKLRVWDAALGMAGEPTTWNIDTTDATFGANGWVGLGGFDAGVGNNVAPWNFLSVATNSETAPCPRTNAEVDAAISSQSAVLAVVMQITAVGYNAGVSPYTKQIKAYFSTFGFASRPWDNPPNQYFHGLIAQIPTVSREMSTALAGQVQTGIGDAILMNPPQGDTRKGILDDLLRLVPKRNIVLTQVGCFDHPLHDFRPIVRGRVGNATAPTEETIRLPIADLSDALNEPLVTTRFGSSGSNPYQGQFYPALFGQPGYVECPLIDSANLRYALNRRAIIQQTPASTGGGPSMFADTTVLSSSSTISAVTPASDLLTSAVAHGMTANWRVVFFLGTPPAPLALETEYWVISSGLTTTDFKVSATRGGAAIDITGSTTGAFWAGFGYDFDYTGPPASVRLANTPASTTRIFAQNPADNDGSSAPYLVAKMYASILFSALGLSLNFKDQASFDALDTALSTFNGGMWFDTNKHTGAEAALRLALGSFTFFCLSPEGLFQVGKIDLPAASAVLTLIESDVKDGSLKLVDTIRPVDMSQAQFTYNPWWLTGPPLQTDALFGARQGKSTQLPYSYGAASWPLDGFPNNTEANNSAVFDSIDTTGGIEMRNRIAALFLKKLGIFELQTRVAAARLSIGQTVSLTHPRMGWKQWSSGDPASPDNTATIDNRLAVVVGVKTNWSAPDEFNTTLKLMRQMPGNYPTANFN